MARIVPIEKMEEGRTESAAETERAPVEEMEKKWNAAIANSKTAIANFQKEQGEEGDKSNEGFCSKKGCKIAMLVVAILLVVAAIVIGIVFGLQNKKPDDSYYNVDLQWQALTFDGWSFGFVGPYGTRVNIKDGGEAWDSRKEFKVKLDIQENKAFVKAELHQSGNEDHHVCCTHELHAGAAVIDSYYGAWGTVKKCSCPKIYYDHQIRAKVSTL